MDTGTTGVTMHYRNGLKILEVDTHKVVYRGLPWASLGGFGKRKFENTIFIKASTDKRDPVPIKVMYI